VSADKIKVLIVDDSALVRRLLGEVINRETDMEVVGVAPDPFVARDKILALHPDVITLDIEMPRMDGLTFLTKLMHHRPMPVIVISSVAQSTCDIAVEAMRRGAVEVLTKPSGPYSVGDLSENLPQKIRAAFASRVRGTKGASSNGTPVNSATPAAPAETSAADFSAGTLIAIGASTGGTQAIEAVLVQVPEQCPPILIAQHIPALFSASFANRLNSLCKIEVQEARDGDLVAPGRALVAPGNFHMMLRKTDGICRVVVKDGPRVHYQRPAVDVLFHSIAATSLSRVVGVVLTGMGSDGAQGLLKLREAGAKTIAQDEASCVVFGMPRAAIEVGAAEQVLPLSHISAAILAASRRPR
jgi:two-component system chemotaxis response regulator CheB